MNQTPNPQNPFVHNELIYSSVTQLSYQQTSLYYIHKINNYASGLIGLLLNLLVLYLIFNKTPKQFKPYSKMLLLCAMTDSYALLCNFLCQSVSLL